MRLAMSFSQLPTNFPTGFSACSDLSESLRSRMIGGGGSKFPNDWCDENDWCSESDRGLAPMSMDQSELPPMISASSVLVNRPLLDDCFLCIFTCGLWIVLSSEATTKSA